MSFPISPDKIATTLLALGETLNSNFVSASLSALAGAAAGVWGAQSLATRAARKSELSRELRLTNAGIVIAFTVCNDVLSSKHQYINPLHEKYVADSKVVEESIDKAKAGEGPIHIGIEANLSKFPLQQAPVEPLKTLLMQSNMLQGREFALLAMIEQSVNGLRESISHRNVMIDEFGRGSHNNEDFNYRYFGLKNRDGHINRMYADTIEAIHSYSDDVAFFSSLLTEELHEHGVKVRKKLTAEFGNDFPKVSTVDFSQAKLIGLIPPPSQYDSWLRGFTKMSSATKERAP